MARNALGKTKSRSTRSSTREDQVAERRRSLLDAAVAVIAQKGLIGTTINSIATEVECSYGVVSFHFNSKEGIILAALDYLVDDYDHTLMRETDKPADRLKNMMESDFSGKVANARRIAVWAAFWAESVRVPTYRERCAEVKARYVAVVKSDIETLAEARGLTVDALQISQSLNAMIDGFWIANLVNGTTGVAGQTVAKQACLAYLRGIFPDDF